MFFWPYVHMVIECHCATEWPGGLVPRQRFQNGASPQGANRDQLMSWVCSDFWRHPFVLGFKFVSWCFGWKFGQKEMWRTSTVAKTCLWGNWDAAFEDMFLVICGFSPTKRFKNDKIQIDPTVFRQNFPPKWAALVGHLKHKSETPGMDRLQVIIFANWRGFSGGTRHLGCKQPECIEVTVWCGVGWFSHFNVQFNAWNKKSPTWLFLGFLPHSGDMYNEILKFGASWQQNCWRWNPQLMVDRWGHDCGCLGGVPAPDLHLHPQARRTARWCMGGWESSERGWVEGNLNDHQSCCACLLPLLPIKRFTC